MERRQGFRIPNEELKLANFSLKRSATSCFRIPNEELKLGLMDFLVILIGSFRIPNEELKQVTGKGQVYFINMF